MRVLAAELHLVPSYSWMPADRRNRRRREYLELLDDLLRFAEEERVDTVVLPGDIFDRVYPSYPVAIKFAMTVKELGRRGIRVMAVPGNHDRYREERRKGPLDLLASVVPLELVHSDEVLRGGGIPCARYQEGSRVLAFCGLGYLPLLTRDPMILLPSTPPSGADRHYLMTHYTFSGFNPYTASEPIAGHPPDWVDFVIAGHIHRRDWILGGRGIYVGLAERIGFGEEGLDVGFTLIDLPEGDTQHLNRETRPFKTIEVEMPSQGDLTEFLLDKLGEIAREEGNEPIMRLKLRGTVPEPVRDTLNLSRVLAEAHSKFFATTIDTRDLETDVIIHRPTERIDPLRILEEIAEEYSQSLDPEVVREAVAKIIEVVRE